MSKERLNCEDICPNHYSSWEEGTCMECCEIYNRGECPVVYVNDLEKQIADLEAKLAESQKNYAELFCRNTELETLYSQKTALLNFYKETLKENTQLKQQLAEKDLRIEELESQFAYECECNKQFVDCQKENENLKQQLAEKDEIIDWQNEIVEGVKQEEELLAQKLKSLGVDCIEDLGKEHNQDKISFCIKQLTETKQRILQYLYNMHDNINIADKEDLDYILDYIFGSQIEELKKEQPNAN